MQEVHPWRSLTPGSSVLGGHTFDPVLNSRSSRFTEYLHTLSADERQRIEAAERDYVSKALDSTSRQKTVAKDYGESLLGFKANHDFGNDSYGS